MTVVFQPLGSGSHGNSVLVKSGDGAILIDAGLDWPTMKERLRAAGQPAAELSGLVLSHRHLDHCRSAGRLARRCGVPLYASERTAEVQRAIPRLERIHPNQPFEVGGFRLHPVRVAHDAPETLAYLIERDGLRLAVATDLGSTGGAVTRVLRDPDLLYLEFNYDPQMLRDGPYEAPLKQRIASPRGHLSNGQAARLLREIAGPRLRFLWTAHVSLVNNTEALARGAALRAVTSLGLRPRIRTALQHSISPASILEARRQTTLP